MDSLSAALAVPSRASLASLPPEQREKEDAARVARQRPILRVCSELALVGIIRDAPGRSGGEWMMKVLKELVRFPGSRGRHLRKLTCGVMETQLSGDPSLSSLPLLTTFLKSYSRPYLGITPPQSSKVATDGHPTENGTKDTEKETSETEEFVEKEIRDRFKKMCEGYFQSVSKKLVIEHNVCGIRISLAHIILIIKPLATTRTGSSEP